MMIVRCAPRLTPKQERFAPPASKLVRRIGKLISVLKAADKLAKRGGGKKSNLRGSENPAKTPTLGDQFANENGDDNSAGMGWQ